jgi:hypothetical protein
VSSQVAEEPKILNPIPEIKNQNRKPKENVTMINANNLIINITQHNRAKSNGKSHENLKKTESPVKGSRFNFNSENSNADEIIR